ncbi:MAG TPA: type III pantothenate kinase [Chloroflexota bacterium]|nr:type III pantothenate kinase [Chloroflexota bacterium]
MVAPKSGVSSLLAIDVGNTNIVLGLFTGDCLVHRWRVATDSRRMPDEYAVTIAALFSLAGYDAGDVDAAIIASVVPAVESTLGAAVRTLIGREPVVVSPALDSGLKIVYSPASAVGADRIANAVETLRRYGAPAIVVDFGTATTFDAISKEGAYVGGAIAPGLEIAQEALVSRAARLTPVPLVAPPSAVGTTTIGSIQSGAIYGYAGLVDGLVRRFRSEIGDGAVVIATGGLAEIIAPHAASVQYVDPDLTLRGLRLLFERYHAPA